MDPIPFDDIQGDDGELFKGPIEVRIYLKFHPLPYLFSPNCIKYIPLFSAEYCNAHW